MVKQNFVEKLSVFRKAKQIYTVHQQLDLDQLLLPTKYWLFLKYGLFLQLIRVGLGGNKTLKLT